MTPRDYLKNQENLNGERGNFRCFVAHVFRGSLVSGLCRSFFFVFFQPKRAGDVGGPRVSFLGGLMGAGVP